MIRYAGRRFKSIDASKLVKGAGLTLLRAKRTTESAMADGEVHVLLPAVEDFAA